MRDLLQVRHDRRRRRRQEARIPKHPHILNASSNLLGIALIIITGLNVSHVSDKSFADEVAWVAAVFLSLACLLSYLAVRADPEHSRFERWSDHAFLIGLFALIASVLVLALAR